jgi:hypothetical protein
MDLQTIPDDLLLNRGKYATIRSAHEDEKMRLSGYTGQLTAFSSQILKELQKDAPDHAEIVLLLHTCRECVDKIEHCAATISELAKQRATLKDQAWPKK